MTVVSFLRSYFPPERMRAALAGRGTLPATVGAAAFGVVTPFCRRLPVQRARSVKENQR
jgi:uncharacterized membrane protein YraQ (UPF0718 family)